MRFRIEECVICGIVNPRLVLRGWVENTVDKILITDSADFNYEIELKKNRKRISYFDHNIPLSKSNRFTIYGMSSSGEMIEIKKVYSKVQYRIKQKFKPKNNKKRYTLESGKYETYNFSKTWDMRKIDDYSKWIKKYETFSEVLDYAYKPLISIVMPVYNVPGEYLGYCIDSILNQTYQNFEICIADDCSTNQDTINTLQSYMKKDPRIKVVFREENGHISEATNSALSIAKGEYVGLMDNDDTLVVHALNEVVKILNEDKSIDFIYSDEDKIDMEGNRSDPHFKADFSLDSLYGGNYICHFSVIRKELIEKVGGFRKGFEGAQDFDLFLRLTNETNNIYHIPKILYHWRMIPGSTALNSSSKNYAGEAGKRALEDYFKRKNIDVNVDIMINTHYYVEYVLTEEPKTEIIIPIKEEYEHLTEYLESIVFDSYYKNIFITLVLKKGLTVPDISLITGACTINMEYFTTEENMLSTINNVIEKVDAKFVTLLDPYSYIHTFDWKEIMAGYAHQKHIALVGCKILDEANIVRKSGIIFNYDTIAIDANTPTFRNDFGSWGRLLVPNNFSAVNSICCMIEKDKFIKLGGLNTYLNYDFAIYDLSLKAIENGYRNIFIPQVEVINKRLYKKEIKNKEKEYFRQNWSRYLDKDPYYNDNMSKTLVFRLEK
jgi:Glycosyltransferases, probably involved in cell wall biogenesis